MTAAPAAGQLPAEGELRAVLQMLIEALVRTVETDRRLTEALYRLNLVYSVQHPLLSLCADPAAADEVVNVNDRTYPAVQLRGGAQAGELIQLLTARKKLEALILFPEPAPREALLARLEVWLRNGFERAYDPLNRICSSPSITDADLLFRILFVWAKLRVPKMRADAQGTSLHFDPMDGGASQTLQLVDGMPCTEDTAVRVARRSIYLRDEENAIQIAFAAFFEAVDEKLAKPTLLQPGCCPF